MSTLEEVRAAYKPSKYFVVDVTDSDDGTLTKVAFRYPKFKEVKMVMQMQKDDAMGMSFNLMALCCLTHNKEQLEAILDDHIALLNTVSSQLTAKFNEGVALEKKESPTT